MSADAWRACPKCSKDNQAKADAAYGKVSKLEYQKLLNAALDQRETLREDYEICTDENGLFTVGYGCYCDVCKLSFTYKKTEQIKL